MSAAELLSPETYSQTSVSEYILARPVTRWKIKDNIETQLVLPPDFGDVNMPSPSPTREPAELADPENRRQAAKVRP